MKTKYHVVAVQIPDSLWQQFRRHHIRRQATTDSEAIRRMIAAAIAPRSADGHIAAQVGKNRTRRVLKCLKG